MEKNSKVSKISKSYIAANVQNETIGTIETLINLELYENIEVIR